MCWKDVLFFYGQMFPRQETVEAQVIQNESSVDLLVWCLMFFKEVSCLELVFLIWLTFVILQLLVKARIVPMGLCTILQGKLVGAQKDTNI